MAESRDVIPTQKRSGAGTDRRLVSPLAVSRPQHPLTCPCERGKRTSRDGNGIAHTQPFPEPALCTHHPNISLSLFLSRRYLARKTGRGRDPAEAHPIPAASNRRHSHVSPSPPRRDHRRRRRTSCLANRSPKCDTNRCAKPYLRAQLGHTRALPYSSLCGGRLRNAHSGRLLERAVALVVWCACPFRSEGRVRIGVFAGRLGAFASTFCGCMLRIKPMHARSAAR